MQPVGESLTYATPPSRVRPSPAATRLRCCSSQPRRASRLYCELCDAQSGRRDAEAVEAELRGKLAEAEETIRHLTHALRDEVEPQTFMGEPVASYVVSKNGCAACKARLAEILASEAVVPSVNTDICLPNGVMFDWRGEPRTKRVRLTFDGAHLILNQKEADAYLDELDADCRAEYTLSDVYLSEREFDDLPEFDGF